MNLQLIGYRGTGKTTVARELADRLGWGWVDADIELQAKAGQTIAEIFRDAGEPAFRQLESEVLADLVRRERVVAALGGGVVLRPENRALLSAAGRVVWLTADAETCHRRIAADANTAAMRPALSKLGELDEIRTLLSERRSLYQECADWVVDTEEKTPAQVAEEIAAWFATVDPTADR